MRSIYECFQERLDESKEDKVTNKTINSFLKANGLKKDDLEIKAISFDDTEKDITPHIGQYVTFAKGNRVFEMDIMNKKVTVYEVVGGKSNVIEVKMYTSESNMIKGLTEKLLDDNIVVSAPKLNTFTTLYKSTELTNPNTEEVILISKVRKDGTKRDFFKVEKNGKAISTTMFARLVDAVKLGELYLKRNGDKTRIKKFTYLVRK